MSFSQSLTPLTAPLAARHGFFTRQGGISQGPYASLNCSLSGADAPACVSHNRALVASHLGLAPGQLLGIKQVHGIGVITATSPWAEGAGPMADALVTATPNLALGIVTADCAPVLFSNENATIIGAAHAGWRGAVCGVLEATASAMRALGAQTIVAAIGPCIHQPSYEVGADLHEAIQAATPHLTHFLAPGLNPQRPGHFQFNLPGYCAARLAACGISATILPHDTYADETRFFSHRRRTLRGEAAIGHQISVIRT